MIFRFVEIRGSFTSSSYKQVKLGGCLVPLGVGGLPFISYSESGQRGAS